MLILTATRILQCFPHIIIITTGRLLKQLTVTRSQKAISLHHAQAHLISPVYSTNAAAPTATAPAKAEPGNNILPAPGNSIAPVAVGLD